MNINIMDNWKKWVLVSGVIALLSVLIMLVVGLNFGIHFTGGIGVQVELGEDVNTEDVREVLASLTVEDMDGESVSLENSFVQSIDESEFYIRTIPLPEDSRVELLNSLEDSFPGYSRGEVEDIGPQVGQELIRNALLSLLVAAVILILYISYRFQLLFAISALCALVFDILIVLLVFSIFNIELNTPFVAAILTIVGYSINDTIVVFDRVRENLKYKAKESDSEIVNTSISQTIVRSVNTSLTTILVLGSLLFLGGETLQPFAIPLFFGVISGTYSSIFVASPVWLALRNKSAKKAA
ncbi:protein translocase subunit SecF [Proteinivorax hydrogeniformans]|uniref:Protein-export membrane protein SecF n=1 Tax=Proteinivorax hydrogeniformans TaxID=1826727 RepID=A0AAU8HR53_9FIRM